MAHKISQQLRVRILKFNNYLESEATSQNNRFIDLQAFLDVSIEKYACSEGFFNESLDLQFEEGQTKPHKFDAKSMMAYGKLKQPSKDELKQMKNNLSLHKRAYGPAGITFDCSEKKAGYFVCNTLSDGKVDLYKLRKDADPLCHMITTEDDLA